MTLACHHAKSLLESGDKLKLIKYLKAVCSNCTLALGNTGLTASYSLRSSYKIIASISTASTGTEKWWTLVAELLTTVAHEQANLAA